MNIYLLISLLALVVCLVIADIVYHKNKQSLSNRLYAIFSLLIAYWIFTQDFMCRQAADLQTALFWSKAGGLWLFFVPVFIHFVFVFTEKTKLLKNPLTYVALYLPPLFFSFMQITTELWGKLEITESGYSIYNSLSVPWLIQLLLLWVIFIVFISIFFLIRFYFKTRDRLKKKQIQFVFLGVCSVGLLGIVETLLVILGVRIADSDSFEMSILNLCIGYAIWKYQLFVLDPATAAENIIATMPDVLLLASPEGIIIRANQSLASLFQYPENEVIGKSIGALFYERIWAENLQYKLLKGDPVSNYETEMPTAKGDMIQVLISGSAVKDKKQQAIGTVYIIHDITQRKRNDAILYDYAEKLKQSSQELQQFVYIASHDLQEPLRKIMVFSSRLKEKSGFLSKKEQDYLTWIQNAAERMRSLINDLLTYSFVTIHKRPVLLRLGAIFQVAVSDLRVIIEQSGGVIEACELPVLEADPTQMRQLFQNLISNALKFHPPGKPPQVKISSRFFGDGRRQLAEICFADNGIGIEPEELERVFEISQRLHGRDQYQGAGMGLAICKKIVENHQGEIRVESAPGAGAQFFITLPIKQERDSVI